MKEKMKNDKLIILMLLYAVFTSTINCLCGMFTEYGVLLFQIWYLTTAAIWFELAITVLVLFNRLSCLNKMRSELQKLERMNTRKV